MSNIITNFEKNFRKKPPLYKFGFVLTGGGPVVLIIGLIQPFQSLIFFSGILMLALGVFLMNIFKSEIKGNFHEE